MGAKSMIWETAKAKINLFLHVGAPDDSGYHPLQSLVAFASVADEVGFTTKGKGLIIDGPFANALSTDADNLILKAARLCAREFDQPIEGQFQLIKNLPVASGIGGGSADAAATLRLLGRHFGFDKDRLAKVAQNLGADVPMCFYQTTALAENYGERLSPARFDPKGIVLINPIKACSTPKVFQIYDQLGRFSDVTQPFENLENTRNDLTEAAIMCVPEIAPLLDAISQTGASLARLSGSGATCFGLFDDESKAKIAAQQLRGMFPHYWIEAGII